MLADLLSFQPNDFGVVGVRISGLDLFTDYRRLLSDDVF
jgi:hypothetical protein